MKITKSSFYPISSLDGKNNFKIFYRIEKDGSIIERVFLDVIDPSERELIICLHYMRHIVRHFHNEEIDINILQRDMPWDFKLEVSTGVTFNVEITSIADINQHFIINKREERYLKWNSESKIPLHELAKLNSLFPDPIFANIVKEFQEAGISKDEYVKNPFYNTKGQIFISNMPETDKSLASYLKEVIDKKASKNHSEKNETVLLIDNRTSVLEVSDYANASKEIFEYCQSLPFPEIWFYTGYFSDCDGNNAEFSFAPLKVTEQQQKILEKMAANNDMDVNGRLVW